MILRISIVHIFLQSEGRDTALQADLINRGIKVENIINVETIHANPDSEKYRVFWREDL